MNSLPHLCGTYGLTIVHGLAIELVGRIGHNVPLDAHAAVAPLLLDGEIRNDASKQTGFQGDRQRRM
ncbi:hypothetical protein LSAT2_011563 [Lamellibrachia satsuma]|nr:hypothetical protein LSAT2_011563 [Lamellibrachia satsuma]